MAAGTTYTPIATTTGTGSSGTVSFTSIPSTYTDLVLTISANGSFNGFGVSATFNGTTTGYSSTYVMANSTANSQRQTSQSSFYVGGWSVGAGSTYQSPIIVHINNYANTSSNKVALTRWGTIDNLNNEETGAGALLWQNTAAINRIDLITGAGNWSTSATFTLYGITAA